MTNPNPNAPVLVHMRIEGKVSTIFESVVQTYGREVATPTGGKHPADGTNGNEYPFQVPTCTSALADLATPPRFTWDGTWNVPLDDFVVTQIREEAAGSGEFWQLALNFKRTSLGGGHVKVATGDCVVWALIKQQQAPANGLGLLKLKGPRAIKVDSNRPTFKVTVIDGETGQAVQGATIGGKTTDLQGQAEFPCTNPTSYVLKANHEGKYVRSNVLVVNVTH